MSELDKLSLVQSTNVSEPIFLHSILAFALIFNFNILPFTHLITNEKRDQFS